MRNRPLFSKFFATAAMVAFMMGGALPGPALAQLNVQVQLMAPVIRFETVPVLVEVSPGVQVVEDYDEEVFFVNGWYWSRSGRAWYRTRDHRGGWVVVQDRAVPVTLVRAPPGRYKHYRGRGHKMKGARHEAASGRGGGHFKGKDMGGGPRGNFKNKDFKEHKHKRK